MKFSQRVHICGRGKNSSTKAPGPDGLQSWLNAALCFLVSLLYSSFFRCEGLFYTAIMDTFGTTRAQASVPFSIYAGFSHLSSLPAGPLIQGCGLRLSTFVGGLLISVGCLMSAFANGIPYLAFSIGVLAGGGHGVLLSCGIVHISRYFEKKRGTALGFNLAGMPLASFFFANIFQICISQYGVRTTIALAGALMLNIPAISFLIHKPPWVEKSKTNTYKQGTYIRTRHSCENCLHAARTSYGGPHCQKSMSYTSVFPKITSIAHKEAVENSFMDVTGNEVSRTLRGARAPDVEICQLSSKARSSIHDRKYSAPEEDNTSEAPSCNNIVLSPATLFRDQSIYSMASGRFESQDKDSAANKGRPSNSCQVTSVQDSEPLGTAIFLRDTVACAECTEKKDGYSDIIAPCSVDDKSLHTMQGASRSGISGESGLQPVSPTAESHTTSSIRDSCREVLSMPRFYVYAVGYFAYCFLFDTVLCVIVDCATDRGISESNAAQIITLFSIADTAGRILVPLLTDSHFLGRFETMTLSYLLLGIISTSLPSIRINLAFAALLVCLGLPLGYLMVAIPETMGADLGLKNLPIAFGFGAGLTAMGGLMTPFLLGYFRDTIGSYDGMFYFLGGLQYTTFSLLCCLWISTKKSSILQFFSAKDSQ